MDLKEYYINLIIKPLEQEIKNTKIKLKKKKTNLTKNIDKLYLLKLKKLLNYYYKKYYYLNNN